MINEKKEIFNIGRSNLDDLSDAEMDDYCSYCNQIAAESGLNIEFELSNDNASQGGVAEELSNYVWNNCDWWTDDSELKNAEILNAISYFIN